VLGKSPIKYCFKNSQIKKKESGNSFGEISFFTGYVNKEIKIKS
jgi:hypothetical protein